MATRNPFSKAVAAKKVDPAAQVKEAAEERERTSGGGNEDALSDGKATSGSGLFATQPAKPVAPVEDPATAAVRKAAEERQQRADEDRTFTHQGPGTGNVPPADPAAGGAILKPKEEEEEDDQPEVASKVANSSATAARDVIAASGLANDSIVRDPITEGRDVTNGSVPTAVTDNYAESTDAGGEFGLSDIGLGRKGEAIDVDDGTDDGVKAPPTFRGDQFGISAGSSGESGLSGTEPGNSTSVSGGNNRPGSDAARGIFQSDIDSARGREEDVASDLLGKPEVSSGGGNDGSGQRLFDLQTQSADLAIAQASATETEPSVAAGDGPVANADAAVEKAALALGAAVAAGGSPAQGAVIAAGGQVFVAARAVDDATGGEFGTAVVNSIPGARQVADLANFIGETVVAVSEVQAGATTAGEAFKAVTTSDAAKAAEAAQKKAADEEAARKKAEEAAAKKAEEDAKKAQEEADKKAAEEAEAAKNKGGGVSTTPDDDTKSPPTPEEFALQQAIKAELGMVRIAGDIDFGEGDGTNTGRASEANLSAAGQIVLGGNESLVGNPTGARVPSGGTIGGTPTGGNTGGNIDFGEENDFSNGGPTRSEDINDINFGPSSPLKQAADEEEDDEEEDDDE